MKKGGTRSVFFGTSRFSVFVLDGLKRSGILPTLIITAPDKPQGRKMLLTPPPVKIWAEKNGVDIFQPEHINEQCIATLNNTPWDIFFTASYGLILPQELLEIPQYGALNVHPSLLPKYRGPSPIQSQILHDDREVGVTIMLMDEKMDHGPILSQARIEIETDDWPLFADDLEEVLAVEGGKLLAESLVPWMQGKLTPEAQDENAATYTKKITKEDGLLDLEKGNPQQNFLKIHAYKGWPGTYFFHEKDGKKLRVKVTDALLEKDGLKILRVIPEGKKEMSYEDFVRE